MKDAIRKLFSKINGAIVKHADEACYPYSTFGVFAIVTYLLFYFIWKFISPTGYENLNLRLLAVFLAIPLTSKKVWPKNSGCLLPLYWYLTLTYSLPFLFTYFLLKNNFSISSVMNGFTVMVLLILLLDMPALLSVLFLGISFGVLCYFIQPHHLNVQINLGVVFVTYLCTLIFGCIFSHKKESLHRQRLNGVKEGMNDILSIIAHEIRTPLFAIKNNAVGAEKVLPDLIKDHNLAKKHQLPVSNIPQIKLKSLSKSMEDIKTEVHYTNATIDLLLTNISSMTKPWDDTKGSELLSMRDVILTAINRYPFTSKRAKSKIIFEGNTDFKLYGSKILVENVFINLIKNALYYTNNCQNGIIRIWIEIRDNKNTVFFEDTGAGVKKEFLGKIFNQFFTLRKEGVGIGLFFCKNVIEAYGGKISCESEYGHYTRFVMEFTLIA